MERMVLKEVEKILANATKQVRDLMNGIVPRRMARPDQSIDQLVAEVLNEQAKALPVSTIAELVGAPESSIRSVLYSNQDKFKRVESARGRVRWRLAVLEGPRAECRDHQLVGAGSD